ncbi:DUF1499 domain-containing protein [Stappia sp. F7233]|uniref:DUF1499 domain-containing protein n=1 Tax=Stappia albiluteola TaxID=2758565 RepID=A0A839A9X2_9HYPH|nr:DUF1499 domain-containing protein [Stappia albiluteola]MBA5776353.1 DUF1499 domain-containing protein [Stappia albiluteola]
MLEHGSSATRPGSNRPGMHKYIPPRRSRSARVSYRAGLFAVPVLVIATLSFRGGLISAREFFPAMGLGFVLGAVAVIAALGALVSLWEQGGIGWSKAVRGMLYGGIALIPAAMAVAGVVAYPKLNDISTDINEPPPIAGRNQDDHPAPNRALQRQAYPDLLSRRFRVTPAELHAAARQVIERQRWTIVGELTPALPDDPSLIQADVRSLVFGFTDDFVIRIRPDPFGARLDLRSASRIGEHDLGANAARIRLFQQDLDAVLLEAYGALEPVGEDDEAPVEEEELPLLSDVPQEEREGPPPAPSRKPGEEPEGPLSLDGGLERLPSDLEEIYEDEPAPQQ